MSDTKVLSLEEIRARIKARKDAGALNVSSLPTFHHEGLGGDVYYAPIPSHAMQRWDNIEQYYPLDHPARELRGTRASNDELDARNREKILLQYGVYTENGTRLDEAIIDALFDDPLCGPDNRALALLIRDKSYGDKATAGQNGEAQPSENEKVTFAFTQWEAAFHDLLVKTGWVKHWVEYVTGHDESTPSMKEAAEKLQKLEEAAPEWAKRLQSQKLLNLLLQADVPAE